MKFILSQKYFSVLIVVFLMMSACISAKQPIPSPDAKTGSNARDESVEVQKTLRKALQQMKTSGEGKINVFVNEESGVVQKNNYVLISYRALLKNNSPIKRLTHKTDAILSDYLLNKDDIQNGVMNEALLIAGDPKGIMGLGKKVVGLHLGESKSVTFTPEEAFGAIEKDKVKSYPRSRMLPKTFKMTPHEYYKKERNFPILNEVMNYAPYVDVKIVKIEQNAVTVSAVVGKEAKIFEDSFGTTVVSLDETSENVRVELVPQKGAVFNGGVIVAIETEKFSVDYNHPLAGETIQVTATVEEIVKPSSFGNNKLEWLEDYGEALELAQENNKPIALFLYADWCEYCKKMLGGTFQDPWVRFFRDRFIWVKVDSSVDKSFFKAFDQKSFPTTVLIGEGGEVIKKLRGYKKADALRSELLDVVNQ